MIFQNSIGLGKSSYDVPSGTTQGHDYTNEKRPLAMVAKSCCHI